VAILQPADMGRLVQMAVKTDLVARAAVSFAGLRTKRRIARSGVERSIPCTTRSLALETSLGSDFDDVVGL